MKYKAFDNKNKRWVKSFYIDKEGNIYEHKVWDYNLRSSYTIVDATLCRSIKKLDKDGKEIFEFDILQDYEGRVFVVKFSKVYSSFKLYYPNGNITLSSYEEIGLGDTGQLILIGNIFDTPHLLEKN